MMNSNLSTGIVVKVNDGKTKSKLVMSLGLVVIYIVLGITVLLTFFPFFWMLMTSFKSSEEASGLLGIAIFPSKFIFTSYKEIWTMVPLWRGFINTMIVELSVVIIGTFISALAAFSFAKMKLPFKNSLLIMLMSGMMIPYAALLLPQYRAFFALGMTDTLLPLILPGLFGNVTMIFFFVQYMKGIPNAFFEAAKIDGATYFSMFIKIMLPLLGPALAAQIIFWFIGIWNDYFAPSIYLTNYDVMTLQAMLARFNSGNSGGTRLPLIMTGAILSSVPMIVIYTIFQKYFVESLAISGVKG